MLRRRRTSICFLFILVGLTVLGYAVLLYVHSPLLADVELADLIIHRSAHRHDVEESAPMAPSPSPVTYAPVELKLEATEFCGGRLVGYGHQFARLLDVAVDRRHCLSQRRGGEPITDVINQDETVEYYRMHPGCFQLSCPPDAVTNSSRKAAATKSINYRFTNTNHLNDWMSSLRINQARSEGTMAAVDDRFTMAITRYEYANLYHTMTDWYNAYLVMRFFNRTRSDTNVLFVDSHPFGVLDSAWDRLFNSSARLADLPADRPTVYRELVWGWLGYNSPMTIYAASPHPKYVEDFRKYFLWTYDIRPRDDALQKPDCSNLTATFIWRHDYVAHPRNPSGHVTRKIANEDELLNRVRTRFPRMSIYGVQIDKLSITEQLKMIDGTDILIGMHGAGLTHALFLPRWAAVIELAPSYWSLGEHFQAIAAWRHLDYSKWVNNDYKNELADGRSTRVPSPVVVTLLNRALRRMCPELPPAELPPALDDVDDGAAAAAGDSNKSIKLITKLPLKSGS